MSGRYKSRTGMGRGLMGIKRLADRFKINPGPPGHARARGELVKLTVEYTSIPRDGEQENGDTVVVAPRPGSLAPRPSSTPSATARAALAAAAASRYLAEAPPRSRPAPRDGRPPSQSSAARGARRRCSSSSAGAARGLRRGQRRGARAQHPVSRPCSRRASSARSSAGSRVFEARLEGRGRLVMFSDGVSSRLALDEVGGLAPRDACRAIMDRYRRPGDDATVLVTDFED